jgi:SAM-dependent methyltransferase
MKKDILKEICCPNCKNPLIVSGNHLDNSKIIDGTLDCRSCGKLFKITSGVPNLILNLGERADLAKNWGFQWSKIAEGVLEKDTYYGQTEEEEVANFFKYFGVSPEDVAGKKILDVGCGYGRLTKALGNCGAHVIGIDIASSLEHVYDRYQSKNDVEFIRADLVTPPFPDASFDYISCKLSLCYVPDPSAAFSTIARLVKPGGRLFISMPDKNDPAFTVRLKDLLRFTHRVPKALLVYICWGLAPLLWLGRQYGTKKRSSNSIRTNAFLLFNALHSKFSRHTREEVISWFKENRFDQIIETQGMLHSVNIRGEKPDFS